MAPFGKPTTVVVSIGRKVGRTNMASCCWQDFKAKTLRAVMDATGDIYFTGEGEGFYAGQVETSYTVIGPAPKDRAPLREAMRALAKTYGQESIAVTYGVTYFEGPA